MANKGYKTTAKQRAYAKAYYLAKKSKTSGASKPAKKRTLMSFSTADEKVGQSMSMKKLSAKVRKVVLSVLKDPATWGMK